MELTVRPTRLGSKILERGAFLGVMTLKLGQRRVRRGNRSLMLIYPWFNKNHETVGNGIVARTMMKMDRIEGTGNPIKKKRQIWLQQSLERFAIATLAGIPVPCQLESLQPHSQGLASYNPLPSSQGSHSSMLILETRLIVGTRGPLGLAMSWSFWERKKMSLARYDFSDVFRYKRYAC